MKKHILILTIFLVISTFDMISGDKNRNFIDSNYFKKKITISNIIKLDIKIDRNTKKFPLSFCVDKNGNIYCQGINDLRNGIIMFNKVGEYNGSIVLSFSNSNLKKDNDEKIIFDIFIDNDSILAYRYNQDINIYNLKNDEVIFKNIRGKMLRFDFITNKYYYLLQTPQKDSYFSIDVNKHRIIEKQFDRVHYDYDINNNMISYIELDKEDFLYNEINFRTSKVLKPKKLKGLSLLHNTDDITLIYKNNVSYFFKVLICPEPCKFDDFWVRAIHCFYEYDSNFNLKNIFQLSFDKKINSNFFLKSNEFDIVWPTGLIYHYSKTLNKLFVMYYTDDGAYIGELIFN